MIADQMPRIRMSSHGSFDEMYQALAFTMLSYYSSAVLTSRSIASYARAWGPHDLYQIPSSSSSYPGATVAVFNSGGPKHVIVAIHGISAISALLPIVLGYGYQFVPGCTGAVYLPFLDRANDMWTKLFALPIFAGAVSNDRYVYTFTGHSLGAAMAEIIAARFKAQYPMKSARLIKFASPRVGTYAWRDNRNRDLRTMSVYNRLDPMHFFPYAPQDLNPISAPISNFIVRNFARDEAPWRMNAAGQSFDTDYVSTNPIYAARLTIGGGNSVTSASDWYDHYINSYRVRFMTYAALHDDALKYRFNWLEMPDENSWQTLFTPGMRDWSLLNVLNPDNPPDFSPSSGAVANIVNNPPAPQVVPPIMQDDDVELEEAGQWETEPALSSRYLPTRVVRRRP